MISTAVFTIAAVALGLLFSLWIGGRADWWWFSGRQERRYVAGDGAAMLRALSSENIATFVPHATALGLYREADENLRRRAGRLLTGSIRNDWDYLTLVNFAETLSELGRFDEALKLTEAPAKTALVESGRRCVRAWILSARGNSAGALQELEGTSEAALANYKAEFWFTLAFAHLTAGQLDDAERAMKSSEQVLVRASSERNFHFLLAQLRWKQGRRDEALVEFETAAKHRWRWQGGSGLLAWGDALKELGRDDEARAAWAQCISQDPQSLAAKAARERS